MHQSPRPSRLSRLWCLSLYQCVCWWCLLADLMCSRQHNDLHAISGVDRAYVHIKSTSLWEADVMAEKLTLDTVWAPGDYPVIPVVGEHFVTGSEATLLSIRPYDDSQPGSPGIDHPWPLKLVSDTVLPFPPLAPPNQTSVSWFRTKSPCGPQLRWGLCVSKNVHPS